MTSKPLALIAELTHRCPLKCLYCSNPLELATKNQELTTDDWRRVIHEAAALGIHQISLTGGEPCARADVVEIAAAAAHAGLYINLITSGIGLTENLLARLVKAGVDHVQLSFQDSDPTGAKWVSGTDSVAKKKTVAEMIRRQPVAFTANLVIHNGNHARLAEMIAMSVAVGVGKIEIAHVQFHGWALKNRDHLILSREQVATSRQVIAQAEKSFGERIRIEYVLPDYHAQTPKPCMGGWARKMLLIDPTGLAAPCHSAGILPGPARPSVRDHDLRHIWFESELFNSFRGTEWMPDPCRSCDKKEQDFGGCRCQAFALTGDASAADPVCHKSERRPEIDAFLARETSFTSPFERGR